jgi:hypothetical protein
MDQGKRALEISRNESEQQAAPAPSSPEVRTLNDLELVLCGGGDGSVAWPG